MTRAAGGAWEASGERDACASTSGCVSLALVFGLFGGSFRIAGSSSFLGLFQAVALAVGLDDMHTIGQAVEHGTCQTLASHDLRPLFEGQVGRDDQTQAFEARLTISKISSAPAFEKGT